MGAQDDLVAPFEEATRLPRSERERLAATLGQLQQAAEALARRAADGAGAEEVAGVKIAAAAAVMRDELRHGPVELGAVGLRQALRRQPLAAHRLGEEERLERDVERAGTLVRLIPEIVERLGVAGRPLRLGLAERRERFGGHYPGRDRRREILGEERAQRLVFPGLHIARRPIVEQAQADDAIARRGDRDRLALRVARPDPDAELKLVIEVVARAEARRGLLPRLAPALGSPHRRTPGAHRRAPPRRPGPFGRNTPSGRLWIGNSAWPLAEATQRLRLLSCVASIMGASGNSWQSPANTHRNPFAARSSPARSASGG